MIREKVKPDWKWCPRCEAWCSVWTRKVECLFCGCRLRGQT